MSSYHLEKEIPLSAYDAFYWYASQIGNVPFSLVLRFRQKLAAGDVAAAVQRISAVYPLLQSKVIERNGRLFFRCDNTLNVPVRDETGNHFDWRHWTGREMVQSFPLDTGPYIRFVVGSQGGSGYLLITCLHVIADARAVAGMLSELCRLLADPAYPPRTPTNVFSIDHLIEPMQQKRLVRQAPAALVSLFRNNHRSNHKKIASTLTEDPAALIVATRRLSENRTRKLVDKARQMDVSVHAAVCVAFVGSMNQVKGRTGDRTPVVSPIDLRGRGRVPKDQIFRNVHTVCIIPVRPVQQANFWTGCRRFARTMAEILSNMRLYTVSAIMQDLYLRGETIAHPARQQAGISLVVSNLGHRDKRGALPRTVDAIYGPAVNAAANEIGLGVVTHNQRMSCLLAGRRPAIDHQQQAEDILDHIETGLRLACLS